jgi:hypothetical protein
LSTVCWVEVATEFGTDLSSRTRANHLRQRIAAAIDSGCAPVTVDFSGVRTISTSFADEVFAVLIQERGEDWFTASIHIAASPEHITHAILNAIAARCEPA